MENGTIERDLSMTTVYRDDLVRIQILRRKIGSDNSQTCIEKALDALEEKITNGSLNPVQ